MGFADIKMPDPHEAELAKEARDKLISLFEGKEKEYEVQVGHGKNKAKIILPHSALEFLFNMLKQMANGNAVTVIPSHAELSTQEAANLLNVSRPFLIKLLEQKKIPFIKVGRHRRVKFADILHYKKTMESESKAVREELTKNAQDLDMGY